MAHIFSQFFQKTKKSIRDIKQKVEKLQQVPLDFEEEKKRLPPPAKEREKVIFDISPSSVAKSTLVILLLLGLTQMVAEAWDILLVFFVSFLLAAAMEPAVDMLHRRRIPRWLAVLLFYIIFFVLIGFVLSNMLPLLAKQMSELSLRLGGWIKDLSHLPPGKTFLGMPLNRLVSQLSSALHIDSFASRTEGFLQLFAQELFKYSGNIIEILKVVSHGVVNFVLVLVIAFFMTIEKNALESFILSLFPTRHMEYVTDRIGAMKKKIGHWLRGMLIMMVSVGLSIYVGLLILGADYAAVLALSAAFLEVLPVIGPPSAMLLALPIVANQSGWLVLWVIGLYLFVQQIEAHILVPIVMNRVTGLSTIAVIFALLIGGRFLGIVGIVLAIPVSTMLVMFLEDYLGRSRKA
jgi:predicted PurR-regulated permease PerM